MHITCILNHHNFLVKSIQKILSFYLFFDWHIMDLKYEFQEYRMVILYLYTLKNHRHD